MELSTAVTLIEKGVTRIETPQVWADLGAGSGLFTKALATLLAPTSTIYAVDRDANALGTISFPQTVTLKRLVKDFSRDHLDIELLDGILMANALHFVSGKAAFVKKVKTMVKPLSRIIIVEYDRDTSNAWVPYPVSFTSLQKLARNAGLTSVVKIGEAPSRYQDGTMYSALLTT